MDSLELQNSYLNSSFIKHFPPLRSEQTVNPMNQTKNKSNQRNVPVSSSKNRVRGSLPRNATETLKAWLIKNWLNPYPTEKQKEQLAEATNLKLEQVNNWLINARRRLLPSICLKYGLDHSKCKINKRGGNKGFVVDKLKSNYHGKSWENLTKASLHSQSSVPGAITVSDKDLAPSTAYKIVLKVPDSPEHPTMLDYLADVMLMSEELEKSPNNEGLSTMELLCRRGLGERMHLCSP